MRFADLQAAQLGFAASDVQIENNKASGPQSFALTVGAALKEIFFFAFTLTVDPSSGLRPLRGAEQPT